MMAKMMFVAAAVLAVTAVGSAVQLDDVERMSDSKCSGSAIYKVVIDYLWTGATHPNAYPSDGHFSQTVVASHGIGYHVWTPHGFSTKGVENVAEMGKIGTLLDELESQKGRNVFDFVYTEEPTEDGSQRVTVLIKLDKYRTYASAIAMAAPSPDWFTGFDDVQLCNESRGKWIKKFEQNLSVWDAGTEKGNSFRTNNRPTRPQEPIVSILGSRFDGVPVGSVKISLVRTRRN